MQNLIYFRTTIKLYYFLNIVLFRLSFKCKDRKMHQNVTFRAILCKIRESAQKGREFVYIRLKTGVQHKNMKNYIFKNTVLLIVYFYGMRI